MKIKKFNEGYYTNKTPKKEITDKWFDSASDDEIKRFILGFNDGQGDHDFYTYKDILLLLEDSENPNRQQELSDMTRSQILDEFYTELNLGGNNSDMVYFNGEEYQEVRFI